MREPVMLGMVVVLGGLVVSGCTPAASRAGLPPVTPARIQLNAQPGLADSEGSGFRWGTETPTVEGEIAFLSSRAFLETVADGLLEDPDWKSRPRDEIVDDLVRAIRCERVPDTENQLDVVAAFRDPAKAMRVTNAMIQSYRDRMQQEVQDARLADLARIQQRAQTLGEEVSAAQKEVETRNPDAAAKQRLAEVTDRWDDMTQQVLQATKLSVPKSPVEILHLCEEVER